LQGSHGYAHQLKDFYSKTVQNPADLPVSPFVQHNLEPTVFLAASQAASKLDPQHFTVRR